MLQLIEILYSIMLSDLSESMIDLHYVRFTETDRRDREIVVQRGGYLDPG